MDSQYHLSVFDSEVFPVTRGHSKLILTLFLKRLNNLITLSRKHADAADVRIFDLFDPDLAYLLSCRHLPRPVWVLFSKHWGISPISKLDLNRRYSALSVLDTKTSDLHA